MAIEIEKKFLLRNDDWRALVSESLAMRQGYLQRDDSSGIRVRISAGRAHLNIKHSIDGVHRLEYEYEIPIADAEDMLDRIAIRPLIEKTRHHVHFAGHLWEIDEFHGENAGLLVAEIELESADQAFERPAWLGDEVSRDARYFNSNLAVFPYNRWPASN